MEYSIRELTRYLPNLQSVSVVPVGLSKYRDGLEPLEPFGKEDAEAVIDTIERWQKTLYEQYGKHVVHASDEWYLLAGRELPEEERYDGYLQLENGVGMLRLLHNEFTEALAAEQGDNEVRELSLATGKLAYPTICTLMEQMKEKFPDTTVHVYPIRNDFFGERITVSGLVTGQDLTAQLKGQKLGERLLIPCNMLRVDEDVFLDDYTVADVEKTLQEPLNIVKSSGQNLLDTVLGREER